ncbi:MAG: hypothetical protein ACKODH_08005 [Limisphaerales bacterium]
MSDEATSKSGKTWFHVVVALVLMPLLYVLSIGPACVCYHRGWLPVEVVVRIYAPLEWAIPHGSPMGAAIESYYEFWLNLTGTSKL